MEGQGTFFKSWKMPWKVTTQVEERKRFIELWQSDDSIGVAALCRELGISRKTAYKWIARYKESGEDGLYDLSKAAHYHPNAISEEIEELIIATRHAHPSWGAKKLLPFLQRKHPGRQDWPSLASFSAILERNQLVRKRRRRRPVALYTAGLCSSAGPNELWCMDHKGWWLAKDGSKCEPFTITDSYSRYLLRCVLAKDKGLESCQQVLTGAFHEFGLPKAIRSDNGSPFASRAPLGLSALSVWFIRLNILHERIEPGKPQQNGGHERMHLTMETDRTQPIGETKRQEQLRLNNWREDFNHERPHEALKSQTPASIYQPSQRQMPRRLLDFEYDSVMQTRKVDKAGQIKWRGKDLFLTEALRGQVLGFMPTDEDGLWGIWLSKILLGHFDEKRHKMKWAKELSKRRD